MTNEEAKHKIDFLKKAYQKLIDKKVDSGKLVGDNVEGEWKAETPIDEVYKDMIESLDMASKALDNPTKTSWIPVTERLPEPYEEVLINVDYKGNFEGIDLARYIPDGSGYIDGKWDTWNDWIEDRDKFYQVTAWMPLPEPYKEESEVEK